MMSHLVLHRNGFAGFDRPFLRTSPAARASSRWTKAVNEILNRPDHAAFNQKHGLEYDNLSIADTQAFMMGELERMSVIAKKANIKLE